ncbi:MAG: LTA synthase family protein [Saprospiraceae bacterium]
MQNLPEAERFSLLGKAFFMGLRFDTVISGYLLILPAVLLSIFSVMKKDTALCYRLLSYFLAILYMIAFVFCSIDVPFFNQFFSRLTVAALNWADTPGFILKMVLQEFSYWWICIPGFLLLFFFWWRLRKIYQDTISLPQRYNWPILLGSSLVVLLLLGMGIRGRLEIKSPIRVGTAYFSNYAFPNQLGLNPVFTFIRSYLNAQKSENQSIQLMDNQAAIAAAQQYLQVSVQDSFQSPIARQILPDSLAKKHNVVIVMMESMSAAKMERYGNPHQLTPFLDSLATQAYSFDNIYTAGIHTFNGIYSTLFSYPALRKQHPMKGVEMLQYHGIASALKQHDYQTIFFTTHDEQFDNVGGFLSANDFEQIISAKDYPADKIKSTLGVPDDYLFEFAVPKLNTLHAKGQPFLAAFMTTSDHGPYIVPPYFKGKQSDIRKEIVEYADWSIRKFLRLAQAQAWFDNTIFVFVADHGTSMQNKYDLPLNYHHSPLIFYAPKLFPTKKTFQQVGGQIDIFPSVMGLLQLPYVNNTLGVDLFKTQRPFIYFSADNKYGVLDQEHFLVVRESGGNALYKYRQGDAQNYLDSLPQLVDSMHHYGKAMFQTTQWMIDKKLVGKTDKIK